MPKVAKKAVAKAKSPAKKVAKSPAKKAAKAPAKKAAAAKSPAKKAAKSPAKTPAKKAAKSPAKKAPAKKAAAKSPAKKAASPKKADKKEKKSPLKKVAKGKVAKKASPVKKEKETKKKAKKAKDPNAPKRALSAFMYFAKEERPAVLKAHPDFKVPEIGKELGARWAKCGNKSKFEGLAAKDKARYDAEMKKFAAKNPKGPKRALSAFMFFAKEERAAVLKAHPDFKVPEIGKELGARWAKCKNKSKFEGLAAKDKARYEAEMKKVKK